MPDWVTIVKEQFVRIMHNMYTYGQGGKCFAS